MYTYKKVMESFFSRFFLLNNLKKTVHLLRFVKMSLKNPEKILYRLYFAIPLLFIIEMVHLLL